MRNLLNINNKTAVQRQWYRLCVFIEIFEHIFHLSLVFLLFTLSVYLFAAIFKTFTQDHCGFCDVDRRLSKKEKENTFFLKIMRHV